jgi:hypothetical protein
VLHTKLSKKNQKKLVNWFARQNILVQINIFGEQKNQFFKLKNEGLEVDILPLVAFLLSIQYFYSLESSSNSKSKHNNLSTSKNLGKFRIRKAKKERYKAKREKLLNLWAIVVNLKSEDFSFRQIAEYLRGHHRFVVSHTYIHNLWKELENGK